jgi:predicted  nucleic acid-binding Zn-ribbon protein
MNQTQLNQIERDAFLGIMVNIGQNVLRKEDLQKELENFNLSLQTNFSNNINTLNLEITGQNNRVDRLENEIRQLNVKMAQIEHNIGQINTKLDQVVAYTIKPPMLIHRIK